MQPPTSADTRRPHVSSARWNWPLAAAAEMSKRPRHARSVPTHRLRDAAALALTGLLTLTGVGAGAAANSITGNIASIDIVADVEFVHERPSRPEIELPEAYRNNEPLNILVLGIDGRFDENLEYGGGDVEGARADTTLIVHISADRQHVAAISIPRDSIVDIPSCPTSSPGQVTRAVSNTRFNAAFARGYDLGGDVESGALCTLATIESLTNVQLDGFVVFDFAGFKNMVDALGGVEMYIPNAIDAPLADGLVLEPGLQKLDGWQSLQFMRARKGRGLGDQSDLTRIGRQQDFLAALVSQVLSTSLLTDSPQLLSFLSTTTASMTASSNFASVTGLASLGLSMRNISPDSIEFIMVPIAGNPADQSTVIWTRAADELWRNVRYNTLFGDEDSASDETPISATNNDETIEPTVQAADN